MVVGALFRLAGRRVDTACDAVAAAAGTTFSAIDAVVCGGAGSASLLGGMAGLCQSFCDRLVDTKRNSGAEVVARFLVQAREKLFIRQNSAAGIRVGVYVGVGAGMAAVGGRGAAAAARGVGAVKTVGGGAVGLVDLKGGDGDNGEGACKEKVGVVLLQRGLSRGHCGMWVVEGWVEVVEVVEMEVGWAEVQEVRGESEVETARRSCRRQRQRRRQDQNIDDESSGRVIS